MHRVCVPRGKHANSIFESEQFERRAIALPVTSVVSVVGIDRCQCLAPLSANLLSSRLPGLHLRKGDGGLLMLLFLGYRGVARRARGHLGPREHDHHRSFRLGCEHCLFASARFRSVGFYPVDQRAVQSNGVLRRSGKRDTRRYFDAQTPFSTLVLFPCKSRLHELNSSSTSKTRPGRRINSPGNLKMFIGLQYIMRDRVNLLNHPSRRGR